jgi:hypothetical protein
MAGSTTVRNHSLGLASGRRGNSWKTRLARVKPAYWSISLRKACPAYDAFVHDLIQELIEFRYTGRWAGTPLAQESSVLFGTDDVVSPLQRFVSQFVQCVCGTKPGTTHFVEDTPFNILAFDGILRLQPTARLVHVFRDPRDVVASYTTKAWSPSNPIEAATFYASVMKRWERIRMSLPASSYLEVGLSSLVSRPERTLRSITDFWALPWEAGLLEIELSRSNRGRWKTDIPRETLPAVEALLAPYIELYGDP